MWYLTSASDEKIIYIVPQKREITVGRSPDPSICDFAIQDDPSISRKHALLTNLDNSLNVKDLGSRYGTFVNNSKVESINIKLNNTDVVKFGKMGSVWNVNEDKLITCTSTMKGENLTILKQVLSKIGGVLKGDWDDSCMYLTMPAITLTIKVVLALVQGSHIVTTQFWNKCLAAVNNHEALPDPSDYTPEVVETTLNKDAVSFLRDNRRRTLFAGKKFVFLSRRQYDMYKPVLQKGSATPILLNESKFNKSMLCENNIVVIQYSNTSTSQETETHRNQINEIVNHLKSKGKRVIADAEIGLAILYMSTNKYCNPGFNFSSEIVKQVPVQQTHKKVLAQETQEQLKTLNTKDNVIIDESLVSSNDSSLKRKISDDEMETNANKKFAMNENQTTNENSKRKHDDEGTNNPAKKMALDNDAEDLFNFITPGSNDISNRTKSADKLNLVKPQKRKSGYDSNEDDLFNFVQNEENDTSRRMFEDEVNAKKQKHENITVDISALRGSKLKELDEINQNWNKNIIKPQNIKKETDDDLDKKMNELDIGSVVVTIKENLIIKKEPIELEDQDHSVKNFKKFKKVWPIKMQVTVISKSSMTVVKPHNNSNEISNNVVPPNDISEESSSTFTQ